VLGTFESNREMGAGIGAGSIDAKPVGNPVSEASAGLVAGERVLDASMGAGLPLSCRLRHPSPCGAKGLSASRGEPRRMMDDEASGDREGKRIAYSAGGG
jgi:hypothetical protein